jgi:hypothetical protein
MHTVHFREILSGYFLFSRFDWSIFVTQLVAKHMKEIISHRTPQWLSPTWMVLIYGEARGHSELKGSNSTVKGFLKAQRILSNARTFVNVVQLLRDFDRFEMNKRDLGRQREDRILVAVTFNF